MKTEKKRKTKYVKNKKDGTYSPLDENGKVVVGLVLFGLPDDGELVGEFEY